MRTVGKVFFQWKCESTFAAENATRAPRNAVGAEAQTIHFVKVEMRTRKRTHRCVNLSFAPSILQCRASVELSVHPAVGKTVAGTVGWLGIDFAVGLDDNHTSLAFSHAVSHIANEFLERGELCGSRLAAVEIADKANAEGNVIEMVAGHMSAVDLSFPTGTDFNFAIA